MKSEFVTKKRTLFFPPEKWVLSDDAGHYFRNENEKNEWSIFSLEYKIFLF